MDSLDPDALQRLLESAVERLSTTAALYTPRIGTALLLIVLGWAIGRGLGSVVGSALRRIGFDVLARRVRLSSALREVGIGTPPSRIVQGGLFWLVLVVFGLAGLDVLGVSDLEVAAARMWSYVPKIIAAGLILGVGVMMGRLASAFLSSGVIVGGVDRGARLGGVAQRFVIGLFAIVAAQQLGLEANLVVAVVSIALATFAIAFALAFSLGAGPVIRHILAGHFLRQSLPIGGAITVEGRRGTVERVGPVDTLMRGETETWTIPNARLLEEVVVR